MSIETSLMLALFPKMKSLSVEEQSQFIQQSMSEVMLVPDYSLFYSPEIAAIITTIIQKGLFPYNSDVEDQAIQELFPQGGPSLGTLIYNTQKFLDAKAVTQDVGTFQCDMKQLGYNLTSEKVLTRLAQSKAKIEICFFPYQVQAGKIKKDNSGAFFLMPSGNSRRGYPLSMNEYVRLAKDGVSATQKCPDTSLLVESLTG